MGKRIITTENLEEDIKIEGQLRPQHLTEYIGQEKAKSLRNLAVSDRFRRRCNIRGRTLRSNLVRM